jgi:hypothetical protein
MVTEAVPPRSVDARELHHLLAGVELTVVAATADEMAPVLAGVAEPEAISVAGKAWWLGRVAGPERSVSVVLIVSGYGGVNAAHALTCLLQAARPKLVVQVGIAGAFAGAGLEAGDLALASRNLWRLRQTAGNCGTPFFWTLTSWTWPLAHFAPPLGPPRPRE